MSSKYLESAMKTRELYGTSVSIEPIPDSFTSQELENFDWFNTSTAPKEPFMPEFLSIIQIKDEGSFDRKLRMLRQLSRVCTTCSMCELGMQGAEKGDSIRDPHVFSNMRPHRFMVVGQNPGWNELAAGTPFVGAAGKNFDDEIIKHDMNRDDFYICNSVRCWTKGNERPTQRHIDRCEPFLQMEINLIKPKLIVTLGGIAFSQLCPDFTFSKSLKKLTDSKYGVKVFPIYHPSPVNFRDGSRKTAFEDQIRIMCCLVKAIKSKYSID